MVCKYFWRLDIKGTPRVKFQVSSTFGSDFNLEGSF